MKNHRSIQHVDDSKQQWRGVYARHNKVWKKFTTLIDHNITEIFFT